MLSRRQFLRLAGMTAAGGALAACRPPQAQPTALGGGKIQLVYQDWRTDWFPPMAQQMLDQFHATHPNIRVFYTLDPPSETFDAKMLADFQAGTAPDVFQGCCTFFPVWAQKDYALDLRPYVQADLDRATIQDWDPVQYRAFFTRDGKQYGLPKYHGALALYYNKDLFDQYKVDYPSESWNHDDYLAAMRRLTHDRDGDGKTDLWGGMAEPPAMQALEWIRERMWTDHVMPTFLDAQKMGTRDAFVAGRAGKPAQVVVAL
jgi:multiple sugar transport system substrate-binding protein